MHENPESVAWLVTDGAGLILDANAAAAAELNVQRGFLIGKPLAGFLQAADLHAFFTRLGQMRDRPGLHTCDVRLWPYRGRSYDAAMRVDSPAPAGSGRTLRWEWPARRSLGPRADDALVPTETSQSVRVRSQPANQTDETLESLRRSYVAAISHDMLTPLAIIKGHAEVLQDSEVRHDAALSELALRTIDEEVERLRRQIANVLDWTRFGTGVLSVERRPVQLRRLIEAVVQRFGGRSRRHHFTAELPEPLPLVLGDAERLESVLYNLLDNAVKYAPRGGEVRVTASVHPTTLEISVTDEGLGIVLAEQPNVFQPYYRLSPVADNPVSGSGLGLSICKAVVEAHGGRIWVVSEPGLGAAIHFTLPRVPPEE